MPLVTYGKKKKIKCVRNHGVNLPVNENVIEHIFSLFHFLPLSLLPQCFSPFAKAAKLYDSQEALGRFTQRETNVPMTFDLKISTPDLQILLTARQTWKQCWHAIWGVAMQFPDEAMNRAEPSHWVHLRSEG